MLTRRSPLEMRDEAERQTTAERRERILAALPGFIFAGAFLAAPIIVGSSAALGWLTGVSIERQLLITAAAAAFFLGALVGAAELVARYSDAPAKALRTSAGIFYVLVNAVAALAAFLVVHGYDLLGLSQSDVIARLSSEALLAGLGAMALFRAAVFNVRVGTTDIGVGPASVLQIIVKAVDRAVDRNRAKPRARRASRLMSGVSFKQAADILPQFCFDSMQNVSAEESQRMLDWVELLKQNTGISDQQKTLLLGLKLMNIVGEEVLESTIQGLGSAVRAQLVIGPLALAGLKDLNFNRATNGLSALCQALALGQTDDWSIDYLNARVEEIEKTTGLDNEVKVMLLASELIKLFGEDILASALGMCGPSFRVLPEQADPTPALQSGGQVVPLQVPLHGDQAEAREQQGSG